MFNNILNLESVDSTNEYLKRNLKEIDNGTVVFTADQTNGKGRFDRSWYGEKGKSIFASFLIKDINEPENALRYSFLFSLGIYDLLLKYLPDEKIILKWPNDILISGKKLCGILSEYSSGSIIIGIGINIFNFVPDGVIDNPWTALEIESERKIDIEHIKFSLVDHINNAFIKYNAEEPEKIVMQWAERSQILNRSVTVNSGQDKITGTVMSIDSNGVLKLATENKVMKVSTGDIEYNDQF